MRFFDHNATTPLSPAAKAAWLEAYEDGWLNPSSPYRAAAGVRVRLRRAREELAAILEVDEPGRIVFNSGASEGNNTVFAHWRRSFGADAVVLVGPTEHPSVLQAAEGCFPGVWRPLPLAPGGAVDPASLAALIAESGARAVSAMAANNETGLLNDWEGLARVCAEAGVSFHVDASQWIGKLPPAGLARAGFVTAGAHKFGGPRGVGFTILPAAEAPAFTSLMGGEQESGHRAGTEDVPGVLAMLAALRQSREQMAETVDPAGPRDRFERRVAEVLPGTRVVGAGQPRLWNTSCLILPPPDSPRWIRALERRGFLVSAGSACSTGKEGPSHVLAALGLAPDEMRRSLRVSAGPEQSGADWDALLAALAEAAAGFAAEGAVAPGTTRVISIEG